MIKPITPQEAATLLPFKGIPDEMIFIVNEILKERYTQGVIVEITVKEITDRWSKLDDAPELKSEYLNFEPYYIKYGWNCRWIKESNAWEDGYDRYEFSPRKD